ncbi:hypothetical protein IQ260_14425 [Leptolyngbya cf. ectocarpi LEGE 11479]|uniref:Uncharacterized protein n=1 Tax=Leptolyngbya cf. ectocarpi LEGE 11479 TaxID=1828722 RepID=A0A928ZUS1_LEPEC|nr:hypothetical protein [Leptolyngbya ectocarpi]MBE9067847.1 hypothetical protein [Leptolyngbya cf. ectocarpi LEGE 11479]
MPSSSQNSKQPQALTLKQAANWQCRACGRLCRRHNELVADFALRVGHDIDDIQAHPRRWVLHVTKLQPDIQKNNNSCHHPTSLSKTTLDTHAPSGAIIALCGSCHRAHHNYQRRQRQQRQQYQQQEQTGQLTLKDIRLPLAGLQLSLHEWGTPYEIVNPQPPRRRMKAPRT